MLRLDRSPSLYCSCTSPPSLWPSIPCPHLIPARSMLSTLLDHRDYIPPVPNLELHSAAADGNLGLVHYALTHGQPVNSVLHGVQPLHAASSGGSVPCVRLLIESGANVNAPRLPRRYSDGKRGNAPSVGTVGESSSSNRQLGKLTSTGSTPLHFAAANGHAPVVQILLTCGATPDKPDKNGLTPEALAEINGHTDVIHVLRVWEHLKLQEAASPDGISSPPLYTPSSDIGAGSDAASIAPSTSQMDEDDTTSIRALFGLRAKERSTSFASNKSDSAGRIKSGLQGLLGRGVRSTSGASAASFGDKDVPGTHKSTSEDALPIHDSPSTETFASPEIERPPSLTPQGSSSQVKLSLERSASPEALLQPSPESPLPSATPSSVLLADTVVGQTLSSAPDARPAPTRPRSASATTSRRPSLPSIIEKATHPGAAFRAAIRRDHVMKSPTEASPPSGEEAQPRHGLFRGRMRSGDSVGKGRKGGRQNLLSLFRRSNSPPSRSPSPPSPPRSVDQKATTMEDIDEGIEKLRKASFDLEMQSRANSAEPVETQHQLVDGSQTFSAPAVKTSFFADDENGGSPLPDSSTRSLPGSRLSPVLPSERPPWAPMRPRTGSEVISPSPLANEWAHDSDSHDSDGQHASSIRRSKTDASNPSPRHSLISVASTAKPRSATLSGVATPLGASMEASSLPSLSTQLAGLGWEDNIDLRRLATIRRETGKLRTELEGDEEEDFVDADDEPQIVISPVPGERQEAMIDHEDYNRDDSIQRADSPASIPLPTSGEHIADDAEETAHRNEALSEAQVASASVNAPVAATSDPQRQPDTAAGRYRGASIGSAVSESSRIPGRFRGASIGSVTTESSRLSTPPGSSMRKSSFASEDMVFDRFLGERWLLYAQARAEDKTPARLAPPSYAPSYPPAVQVYVDTRARGNTVSSTSTSSHSASIPISTPPTSLSPPSTLSFTLASAFPPVPEHDIAMPPPTRRKISTRAEVREAVKQNEDDIMQLAQLPLNLESSLSLAAQLAEYGDNHAREQAMAEEERRQAMSAEGSVFSDQDEGIIEMAQHRHEHPSVTYEDHLGAQPQFLGRGKGKAREGSVPSIEIAHGRDGDDVDVSSDGRESFVSAASRPSANDTGRPGSRLSQGSGFGAGSFASGGSSANPRTPCWRGEERADVQLDQS